MFKNYASGILLAASIFGASQAAANTTQSVTLADSGLSTTLSSVSEIANGIGNDLVFNFAMQSISLSSTYEFLTSLTETPGNKNSSLNGFTWSFFLNGNGTGPTSTALAQGDQTTAASIDIGGIKFLSNVNQYLTLVVSGLNQSNTILVNSPTFKTLAVPGPIAGTGLPALLGLLGLGLYARRRRRLS